jgi:hypothetical protein
MKTHGMSRRAPSFLALHMSFACYTLSKLLIHLEILFASKNGATSCTLFGGGG